MEHRDLLLHADDTHMFLFLSFFHGFTHIKPVSIVRDGGGNPLALELNIDVHLCGVRMLGYVGQQCLGNAEDCDFNVRREATF